jgi:hypothetical protein
MQLCELTQILQPAGHGMQFRLLSLKNPMLHEMHSVELVQTRQLDGHFVQVLVGFVCLKYPSLHCLQSGDAVVKESDTEQPTPRGLQELFDSGCTPDPPGKKKPLLQLVHLPAVSPVVQLAGRGPHVLFAVL